MTVEQLMAPRFLVTDPYPNNNDFPVGKIVEFKPWNTHYWQHSIKDCQGERNWLTTFFETYPNIFKPLPWYSHRKIEEMPKHLKHTIDGKTTYHEIVEWDIKFMVGYLDNERYDCCSLLSWSPEYTYQPATELEYNEYINSLK